MCIKTDIFVSVDIGGRTEKADNSLIRVIDRRIYCCHTKPELMQYLLGALLTDPDLLAWKAAQIATKYCNALLIIEGNSLETEEEETIPGTVLDPSKTVQKSIHTKRC